MFIDSMVILVGLAAGVISGLLGIGGAIFMIPMLVLFFGMSQHTAQGTTLAMMLPPVTILAVIAYHKEGSLDWKVAALLCIGFVFGSFFGAKIALNIPEDTLKKLFGFALLLVSVRLIIGK